MAICKLTGDHGKFVKAHIIPDALTRPTVPGMHFIQAGENSRPIKRWSSWYDQNLVTLKGEKILAKFDQNGISVLRKHNLIWSGWANNTFPEPEKIIAIDQACKGIRVFDRIEANELRLFFLSILWRASASKLNEFRQIRLSSGQLNKVRKMLLSNDPNPNYVFPICLTQFITTGPRHNHTPLAMNKILSLDDPTRKIPIFRFYFDGLVIHFHRDISISHWRKMGGLCLGANNNLGVITMPYEISMQNEMVEFTKYETEQEYGNLIERLARSNVKISSTSN